MNMTWINRAVYTILERIGSFQVFFSDACKWISAICFLVALGTVCIEIFLQACDARKELIRLTVTVVTYFIMIFFFPLVMKNMLAFGMNLGYGAVFSGGLYEADVSTSNNSVQTSQAEFYKWLDEETGGIFSTSTSDDGSKVALNFNLVDPKTGYIDLNKTFTYILAFIKIGWKCFPKFTLFQASFTAIGISLLYFFALIVVIICYFVVLINYVMCLIDYFALTGFGILMIPLSLWKGTKPYTQAIYTAIGKILVKLIVISSMMFLSIMSIVDLFTQIYMHSIIVADTTLAAELDDLLNMSVTLLFQAPLLAVITMQTEKIANFLTSGHPSLSFGDFALGAGQTAAMAMGAGMATKGTVNAVSRGSSAISSGITGAMAAKDLGGGAKSMAKSAIGSMANTAKSGLKEGIKNMPNSLANGINNFSRMSGVSHIIGNGNYMNLKNKSSSPSSATSSVFNPETSSGQYSKGTVDRNGNETQEGANTNEDPSFHASPSEVATSNYDSGVEGVYGNVDTSKENVGINDKALQFANRASRGGVASQILGSHVGTVSSAIDTIKKTRGERKDGNKVGNSYVGNVAKTYVKSRIASSSNRYGESKVYFAKSDSRVSESLRGQSATVVNRGAGEKKVKMDSGEMGTSRYMIRGNEDFYNALKNKGGPTDEDAVENVLDINKKMNGESNEHNS